MSGEIAVSKLTAVTTQILGDMPILKTDEPQSTLAEPTETPRRTDNLETATKNVDNVGIFGLTNTDELMSGDTAPSKLAAATPIPKGDITTLMIGDDIDGIESSRKYDGIDGIEPSNDRVDTADVFRNALQSLARTPGILLFKVKHTFPCPIAHSDVDWGGLSPGSFGDKLASPGQLKFFFFSFSPLCFDDGIT